MRTTVQGLIKDANQVNQNYADAFRAIGNTVTASPPAPGQPFGSIDTGNNTAQANVVQEFEDAINSDLKNGNDWATAIQNQQQYDQQKRQNFAGNFTDNAQRIQRIAQNITRDFNTPISAVDEEPEEVATEMTTIAVDPAAQKKIVGEINALGNKLQGMARDAKPVIRRANQQTKRNV
jgi:hypothetical protein